MRPFECVVLYGWVGCWYFLCDPNDEFGLSYSGTAVYWAEWMCIMSALGLQYSYWQSAAYWTKFPQPPPCCQGGQPDNLAEAWIKGWRGHRNIWCTRYPCLLFCSNIGDRARSQKKKKLLTSCKNTIANLFFSN